MRSAHYWLLITVAMAGVLVATITLQKEGRANDTTVAGADLQAQLFEQRVYTTAPGKLDALHSRFRDHTNYLFVKHGMHLIGYWTPVDRPDTLIYLLAYPDREAREASWKAFMDDQEWQRVWEASKQQAGGQIVTQVVSTFLKPTDYSPIR